MGLKMGAAEVLATHRISLKTIRRPNGAVDHTYSIQFTYERGKKKQISGKTEEEVRRKVYEFFHVSALTFRELYEKWQNDGELTEAEKKKASAARFSTHLPSMRLRLNVTCRR